MSQPPLLFLALLFGCHEPCKDGHGRAEDNLCYPLAERPCGEGYGRTDDGECTPIGLESDDADADADVDADADSGPTGFQGTLDLSDGFELDPDLSFTVRAWTTDQLDPITGWPLDDEPFLFHTFNVVAGGITLNYTFPIDEIDSDGAEIRVTAELQGDGFPWNTAQPAAMPADPSDRFSFEPGTWISDVNFTIQLDAAADTGGR